MECSKSTLEKKEHSQGSLIALSAMLGTVNVSARLSYVQLEDQQVWVMHQRCKLRERLSDFPKMALCEEGTHSGTKIFYDSYLVGVEGSHTLPQGSAIFGQPESFCLGIILTALMPVTLNKLSRFLFLINTIVILALAARENLYHP